MGSPMKVGAKTFVLELIGLCPCEAHAKKVKKVLRDIHGIGSIAIDLAENKVTITDSMVNPDTVIMELKKKNKKAKLLTEEIVSMEKEKGKQIVEYEPEVLQDVLRVYKPFASNQVVDESALVEMKDPRTKHKHTFELKNFARRFTCNGCKEEGFGPRYRCQDEECDYELHQDCKLPQPTISHELFEGSTFEFSREKPRPTCGDNLCKDHPARCEACGKGIHGYFYHCKSNGLSLHPCCVNLKGRLCLEGTTLVLKSKASTSYKCCVCGSSKLNSLWGREKRTHSGWSYVSESNKYQIHVNCIAQLVAEMAHEAWKKRDTEVVDDAYRLVLEQRLNKGLIKKSKTSNGWPRGTGEFVKLILTFARAIIGILLGDPTVILASMVVEAFKK